jgi:hypothetical protein
MRFMENSPNDDVHPGGTITITLTATSSAVSGRLLLRNLTTTAFSDSAFTNSPRRCAGPTVRLVMRQRSQGNTTNFTFERREHSQ